LEKFGAFAVRNLATWYFFAMGEAALISRTRFTFPVAEEEEEEEEDEDEDGSDLIGTEEEEDEEDEDKEGVKEGSCLITGVGVERGGVDLVSREEEEELREEGLFKGFRACLTSFKPGR
jgi:hypothetical protein